MPTKGQASIPSPDTNECDELKAALQHTINIAEINRNLDQSVIVTTEDKLRLLLKNWRPVERGRWKGPLGILIALLIALTTSSFHDFLFIKKDTLKDFVIFSAVLVFLLLIRSLWLGYQETSPSVDDLVAQIKSGTAIRKL